MNGYKVDCNCGYTKTSKTQGLANKALTMHSCQRQHERDAMAARVQARRADTGTKRDCHCKIAQHTHGTRQAYVIDRCRCRPCRDALSATRRHENKLKAYGRYTTGRVPITPIQNHIQHLQDNGISVKQLSRLTGLSLSTLGAIKWGRTERNNQQYTRVLKKTATKILAITPGLEHMAAGRPINATGTRRRLQALMCLGYGKSELGRRLNITPTNMTTLMQRDQVTAGTARKTAILYEQLWNHPRTGTDHRTKISINRARNYATTHHYLPPMAWDDDTIDNPDTQPADTTKKLTVHEQRMENLEHMLDTGTGHAEIMTRLNVSPKGLRQSIQRAQRQDLGARLTTINHTRSAA